MVNEITKNRMDLITNGHFRRLINNERYMRTAIDTISTRMASKLNENGYTYVYKIPDNFMTLEKFEDDYEEIDLLI